MSVSELTNALNTATIIDGGKCPVCSKTVYQAEQIVAVGSTWHQSCFCCGGAGDLGCKRKISLANYRGTGGVPYCEVCFSRLAQHAAAKVSSVPVVSSEAQQSEQEIPKVNISDRASLFRTNSSSTSGCLVCGKTVYQAEQLIALTKTWHKLCFCCGGTAGNGCNRKLDLSNYHGRSGNPYCNVCFDRLAKQTSAGVSNLEVVISQTSADVTPQEDLPRLSLADRAQAFKGRSSGPPSPDVEVRKTGGTFRQSSSPAVACAVCGKTVYQAEQLVTLSKTWHKLCFCCGGTAGNGCNRKLDLSNYHGRSGNPYCNVCFDRLAKQTSAGVTNIPTLDSTVEETGSSEVETPQIRVADLKATFKSTTTSTAVCPVCTKQVFKAEEMNALNSVWHQACFYCGGAKDLGCRRKLSLGQYHGIAGVPYCEVCFDRLAKQAAAKAPLTGAATSGSIVEEGEEEP